MTVDRQPGYGIRSVLFICTGNICRSPLAEYLFREYVRQRGAAGRFEIASAGTHALEGNHAMYEAIDAGRQRGLDLTGHRARAVDAALLEAADHVLVMTREHYRWLAQRYPVFENKLYLTMLFPRKLTGQPPGATDVPDPIGESVDYYLRVLDMLEPVVPVIYSGAFEEDRS